MTPQEKRFYVASGRYGGMNTTRYKDFTYGTRSFSNQEEPEDTPLKHGTYGGLIRDKRWLEKRAQIIARDHHACVICGNNETLQVHHRQYHFIRALGQFKAPWEYADNLMITLCERCHSRGHSKFRVPNVYL